MMDKVPVELMVGILDIFVGCEVDCSTGNWLNLASGMIQSLEEQGRNDEAVEYRWQLVEQYEGT